MIVDEWVLAGADPAGVFFVTCMRNEGSGMVIGPLYGITDARCEAGDLRCTNSHIITAKEPDASVYVCAPVYAEASYQDMRGFAWRQRHNFAFASASHARAPVFQGGR